MSTISRWQGCPLWSGIWRKPNDKFRPQEHRITSVFSKTYGIEEVHVITPRKLYGICYFYDLINKKWSIKCQLFQKLYASILILFSIILKKKLKNILSNASISVCSQNPTIPRSEGWFWIRVMINKDDLKWNLCSFPWWKEPKIKAVVLLLKRKFWNYWWFRFDALYFVCSWTTDFVGDLLRSYRQTLAFQFVHKTQQFQGQR